MTWKVARYETRKVAVMEWVGTPEDAARMDKEARDAELWRLWREQNPDAVVGYGKGCSLNHLALMPGVVDEEYCGSCGADLGIPPEAPS